MSASQFQAGKSHGEGQGKADHIFNAASDKAGDAKQSTREAAEQAGGFMQQAGEKVAGMASNATEAVKNTVGIGSDKSATTAKTTTTTTTKR